jgi:hypothetical protein
MPKETVPRLPPSPTGARVIHLTDFAEVCSFFSSWQGQFDQLSRGRFGGTLQVVLRAGVLGIGSFRRYVSSAFWGTSLRDTAEARSGIYTYRRET